MSDPLRADPARNGAASQQIDAGRDAKIENLLISGLDHYFASDYAQAIDIWSRALFLDRQHARARAYIDRARSALAEQQRESEELLHNGVAAFERGEIEAARQLLNAAVQRGGAHDVALAFLTRIDRINAAAPAAPSSAASPVRVQSRPDAVVAERRRWRWLVPALSAVALVAAAVTAIAWDRVALLVSPFASVEDGGLAPVRTEPDPVVVPLSSEMSIQRARSLFATGRLYDALRALERVQVTDPVRAEADGLKADIQRELLAHQASPDGADLVHPPTSASGAP